MWRAAAPVVLAPVLLGLGVTLESSGAAVQQQDGFIARCGETGRELRVNLRTTAHFKVELTADKPFKSEWVPEGRVRLLLCAEGGGFN